MADILKRNKALSVNPLKASQPIGGSLATLGFNRAMPMLHGSQGCTAFAKVFFVRHFREPIPLQSTAMDQGSSVMGADENVREGIKSIAGKSRPALITILTTGLAETQGCDLHRNVREFREANPEFTDVAVVAVNTPDFTGSVETGYAATQKIAFATTDMDNAQLLEAAQFGELVQEAMKTSYPSRLNCLTVVRRCIARPLAARPLTS